MIILALITFQEIAIFTLALSMLMVAYVLVLILKQLKKNTPSTSVIIPLDSGEYAFEGKSGSKSIIGANIAKDEFKKVRISLSLFQRNKTMHFTNKFVVFAPSSSEILSLIKALANDINGELYKVEGKSLDNESIREDFQKCIQKNNKNKVFYINNTYLTRKDADKHRNRLSLIMDVANTAIHPSILVYHVLKESELNEECRDIMQEMICFEVPMWTKSELAEVFNQELKSFELETEAENIAKLMPDSMTLAAADNIIEIAYGLADQEDSKSPVLSKEHFKQARDLCYLPRINFQMDAEVCPETKFRCILHAAAKAIFAHDINGLDHNVLSMVAYHCESNEFLLKASRNGYSKSILKTRSDYIKEFAFRLAGCEAEVLFLGESSNLLVNEIQGISELIDKNEEVFLDRRVRVTIETQRKNLLDKIVKESLHVAHEVILENEMALKLVVFDIYSATGQEKWRIDGQRFNILVTEGLNDEEYFTKANEFFRKFVKTRKRI